MYHYISVTADHHGGILYRDPDDIREEITAIRGLLNTTANRMREAERLKEELLLALSRSALPGAVCAAALDSIVEDCSEMKRSFEELWEQADCLADELSETLAFFGGGIA